MKKKKQKKKRTCHHLMEGLMLTGVNFSQPTIICLSIGTPENNKFSIVPNGKFIIFRCPKILANYILTVFGLNIGTQKNH